MQKTAYLIFSTRHTDRTGHSGVRAFTLVEAMVAIGISSFILTGVVSAFLMIGRSSTNAYNYCVLDSNTRQGLETFSREIRIANSVSAFSSTSITIGIPDTSSGSSSAVAYSVTYAYDSGNKIFTRTGPPLTDIAGTSATTTLVNNVKTFSLKYYSYLAGDGYVNGVQNDNTIATDGTGSATAIKQIELTLTAQTSNVTVVNATNAVLSARFILRNKS
jgi:Tfp pilus assembly protein PilW